MAFHHLPAILSILCLAFAATQAALPGEVYWNSLLPNTTMPRAISNVLLPGKGEETVPDLSRSGYQRKKYTAPPTPNRKKYTLNTEENDEVLPDLARIGYYQKKYTPPTQRKKYTLNTEENDEVLPDLARIGYSQRTYTPPTQQKKYTLNTEENDEVLPDLARSGYSRKKYTPPTPPNRRKYGIGSKNNDVPVNTPSAPWFLEKDLYPGNEMEMEIGRPESNGYTFVPRQVADSIPFSSDKLATILDKLSIKPESPKAELLKDTLKECELPAEEGEVKTCATSLESMIDFSIQHLGKDIQAVSTEAEKDTKLQNFTMLEGIKQIGQSEAVACQKENYAYAVFYCHDVRGARAYTVPFVGTSGTKVKAVGVCHTNTTAWSPEHEAFKILKVKPGGEPICHFLPEYNVLWTRK